MCNRESFILLPHETGIPVAWSTSYHHEMIGKHLFKRGLPGGIQIECIGGDVIKWDWDNTPKKKVFRPDSRLLSYTMVGGDDFLLEPIRISESEEWDLPHWLEDNLHTYENKVESILERLNPLRDRQERLLLGLTRYLPITNAKFERDAETLMTYAIPDSPEVREFEQIIAGYREIPGFVHAEFNPKRQEEVWVR